MAKNRTNNSKYHSRYSEGFVSAPQYITELICEKKAKKEKKELPIYFWKLPEWEKFFKSQIFSANALLKKYSEKSIISVLMSKECSGTYSLRAKWLIPLFDKEELKNRSIVKEATNFTETKIEKVKPVINPLQKLMDIE